MQTEEYNLISYLDIHSVYKYVMKRVLLDNGIDVSLFLKMRKQNLYIVSISKINKKEFDTIKSIWPEIEVISNENKCECP